MRAELAKNPPHDRRDETKGGTQVGKREKKVLEAQKDSD